jgi:hypothetical protein
MQHPQRTKKYVTCSNLHKRRPLGESSPVNVNTSDIEVSPVNLSQPSLNNSIVDLNWERYQGYYFSHYEIEVRNYSSGSGGGYQEQQLAVINNIETLITPLSFLIWPTLYL